MKRHKIIPLVLLIFLSLLSGCTNVLSITDLTNPTRTTMTIQDQSNDDQIIKNLVENKIIFAIVPLKTAVDHYLHGSRLVVVAGYIDKKTNDQLVLVTTPDLIRNQREKIEAAVHQFFRNAEENHYTIIELDDRILIKMIKEDDPTHHFPSKMNLSWLIDRSFTRGELRDF